MNFRSRGLPMGSQGSKELQKDLAGLVVAAGCIVFIVGLILVAGAVTAQNFWRGATMPGEVQAAIDDGMRKGLGSIILGVGLVIGGWLWVRGLSERRSV